MIALAVAGPIEATKLSEVVAPRNLASIEKALELKVAALRAAVIQSAKNAVSNEVGLLTVLPEAQLAQLNWLHN